MKVTWTFTKEYSPEEFVNKFQEMNDVMYEGYFVIAADRDAADGVDDFNLDFTIEE